MTWKHLHGDAWHSATVKRLEDDQWVPIGTDDGGGGGGGGDGEIPSRFYTDGPPERSGETITYPADGHASIEDAIYALSPGDELYIEPGTYSESITLDSSVADHITIRSDLELAFDSDGRATIAQEGATIEASGNVFETEIQHYGNDTSLAGSYEGGGESGGNETEIAVADASHFSPGDVVFIEEDTRPYGEPPAGGGSGASTTIEHRRVADVDTSNDVITVEHPLLLPYPNENETRVTRYDFTVEDLRVSGIEFDGGGNDTRPVRVYSVFEGWFDDIVSRNAGDDNLLSTKQSFRCRFDGYHVENGGHYGLNCYQATTDTAVTNASGHNHVRYVVRLGPTSDSSAGLYADGVCGDGIYGRTVVNCHHGGFHYDVRNVTALDSQVSSFRSRHITLSDFEKRGSRDPEFVFAQRPYDVTVENGTVSDKPDDANAVFGFRLRNENDAPYGAEGFTDITIRNVDIEAFGSTPITDIGYFEGDQGGDGLHFENVTYGGQKLTESDVESWSGWDDVTITNLTVE